jgi:hypothetical protein
MTFAYDVTTGVWDWSLPLRELHGLESSDEPTTDHLLQRMVPEDCPVMLARFQHHLTHPGPYSCTYRMVDPRGHHHELVFVGQSEATGDRVTRLYGLVVDITDEVRERSAAAVAASAEHRATIEQAKGALMLSFGVGEDVAFSMLRTYSNQHNLKLTAVAEFIVRRLTDPEFSRYDPVRCVLDILMELDLAP